MNKNSVSWSLLSNTMNCELSPMIALIRDEYRRRSHFDATADCSRLHGGNAVFNRSISPAAALMFTCCCRCVVVAAVEGRGQWSGVREDADVSTVARVAPVLRRRELHVDGRDSVNPRLEALQVLVKPQPQAATNCFVLFCRVVKVSGI